MSTPAARRGNIVQIHPFHYPAPDWIKVIPAGVAGTLRPDLYFPDIEGQSVIFDVGSPSKLGATGKYSNLADLAIPLIPDSWVP